MNADVDAAYGDVIRTAHDPTQRLYYRERYEAAIRAEAEKACAYLLASQLEQTRRDAHRAEGGTLDVERLATILCHGAHVTGYVWCRHHRNEAEAVAAEYARLSEQER